MNELGVVRSALRRTYPAIAGEVSDAEIRTMIEEARQRLGAECSEDQLIDLALARAADVASERAFGKSR